MPVCQRCGQKTSTTIMSMFNTQIICLDCKGKETKRPDYKAARDAEHTALRRGDRNFGGIGLTGIN